MEKTHDSVESMVRAYSQAAVELAREFKTALDYTENSVMEVEVILAQFANDLASGKPPAGEMDEMCKLWGSYLGEVVRRRFGGEWGIETYPGKEFATLTLNVGGNKLFPSMKIHRRLTVGENDNVWTFYKMIKAKLESMPGGKVQ
ncbi:MAG TPA: hypothetical protein VG759_25700 [Candidatus Angelobacter sp.]|jgi:hypothetical protein|nr:hypothetical protein [Candidatus Angelobacter sp.]